MKEKYLQIFKYLLEFSKIRSKPVRDIENSKTNYVDILWMSDLPEDKSLECIVHKDFSEDNEFWLKVYKPVEPEKPKFPSPPQELKDWIDKATFKRHKKLFGYTDIGWTIKHPKQLVRVLVAEGVWNLETDS